MEQFNTKELELVPKELELERKELELERKELELEGGKKAHKSFEKATNTDSSENHGTPELIQYLYAIFLDEPAISSEEKDSLLKSLVKLNKRRTEVKRWKNSGKSLNKS